VLVTQPAELTWVSHHRGDGEGMKWRIRMNIEKKEGGKAWRADWRTGVGGKNNQEDIKGGKTLCGVRVVRTEELEGGC
jgi:hypothetical protein